MSIRVHRKVNLDLRHLRYATQEAGYDKIAEAIIDHGRNEEGTTKEETKIYMQVSR